MSKDFKSWVQAFHRIVRDEPRPIDPSALQTTFATVRSLGPLRIALDTDPENVLGFAPPCVNTAPTEVGQRVLVQAWNRQVVIVGVLVGSSTPPPASSSVMARLVKLDGSQSVGTGGAAVNMVLDYAVGGPTFDTGNGGGIRISEPGHYVVAPVYYFTGASGLYEGSVRRWRAGADFKLSVVTGSKVQASGVDRDLTDGRTDIFPLQTGDVLTMKAAATANIYGIEKTGEKYGTALNIWKVAS